MMAITWIIVQAASRLVAFREDRVTPAGSRRVTP